MKHISAIRSSKAILYVLLIGIALFVAPTAIAGDLYPPGSPGPTMKNLQELYDQAEQTNRAAGGGDALLFFPYVLERSGDVASTQYTFDTVIYLLATGMLAGQGLKSAAADAEAKNGADVTVNLYLYNNNGQPATSALGTQVANPASFTVGPANPKISIRLETLFQDAGGFASPIFIGFAVLSIGSGNWNDVAVDALIAHSHTGPGDLEITPLHPTRIQDSLNMSRRSATAPESRSESPGADGNR